MSGEPGVRRRTRIGGLVVVGVFQVITLARVMLQIAVTSLASRLGYWVPDEAGRRLVLMLGLCVCGMVAWTLMYKSITRGRLLIAAMAACSCAGAAWWLLP